MPLPADYSSVLGGTPPPPVLPTHPLHSSKGNSLIPNVSHLSDPKIDANTPLPIEPGHWDFLKTNREQLISFLSRISYSFLKNQWVTNAPAYFPDRLAPKVFEYTAPSVAFVATIASQVFFRTFDYSTSLDSNPVPFGERVNRSIKSLAYAQVSMATFFKVLQYTGAGTSYLTSTLGATAAPIWATTSQGLFGYISYLTAKSLGLAYFTAVAPLSLALAFVTSAACAITFHKIINKLGIYAALSNSLNFMTRSKPQIRKEHEELNIDVKLLHNLVMLWNFKSPIASIFGFNS